MAERRFWAADRLRILVEGPDARHFLSDAAAAGRDLACLRQLAERSGLQLRAMDRETLIVSGRIAAVEYE